MAAFWDGGPTNCTAQNPRRPSKSVPFMKLEVLLPSSQESTTGVLIFVLVPKFLIGETHYHCRQLRSSSADYTSFLISRVF
jgi:hypothetical protein